MSGEDHSVGDNTPAPSIFSTKDDSAIDQVSFVSDSAMMIAYERALETDRADDALFRDPFARQLAGDKGEALSRKFEAGAAMFKFVDWPEFHKNWTAVRTKYIDSLLEALDACDGLQMVNLGAGMDTRPWRLPCCSNFTRVYEVDLEATILPKASFFKSHLGIEGGPLVATEAVAADLLDLDALATGLSCAGYDRSKPSVFLAEGLIMYLGDKGLTFLKTVSSLAAEGSTLILNFIDSSGEDGVSVYPGTQSPKELQAVLEPEGWTDLRFNIYGDDVLNYGRYKKSEAPNKSFSFLVCTKL